MARGFHEVIFASGAQDLVHVPPARVTSATFAIEDLTQSDDSSTRFIVAAGSVATIDTYDVAITAQAGRGRPDPRLMTHAGATATVGRDYFIETAGGAFEKFTCDEATSTTILAGGALSGLYASGSHVRGAQISASFPSLNAGDEDLFDGDPPLRVRWTYVLSGTVWRVDEIIRLVRAPSGQRALGAVEAALRQGWPELVGAAGSHGNRIRDMVARVSSRLDARLRGRGINPETLMAGGLGFELLLQRCVLQLAEDGFHPKTRDAQLYVDEQAREFVRLWEAMTVGTSAEGAADIDRDRDMAAAGTSRKVRSPFVRG